MSDVVFVAPFFLPATLRFISAVASLDDVRMGLISQDPETKLPAGVRARLAGHHRVDSALDPSQLVAAVRRFEKHFGAQPARLIGTLEELQVPLGVVRDELGIAGIGAAAANNFRDKEQMKRVLAAAGLPCARHRLIEDAVAATGFAAEVGFPLVVKPPAGAGARGTYRLDSEGQLAQYLEMIPPSLARPALFEEFMTGDEHSFDSVSVDGEIVWSSVNHYYPSPLEVVETPWIQWCVVLPREVDDDRYGAIRAVAGPALKALGLDTGLSHMEWFRRPDGGVAISEIGARPPGAQFMTLISYAHDVDMYRAWAQLAATGRFEPPERPYAAGAVYLRGQGDGTVQAVHGLAEAQAELGGLVVEAKLPKLGQSPSGGYEGEGYVILRHPGTAAVERGLAYLLRTLRVELGP